MFSKSDQRASVFASTYGLKYYFQIFLREKQVLEIFYCTLGIWGHFLVFIVSLFISCDNLINKDKINIIISY